MSAVHSAAQMKCFSPSAPRFTAQPALLSLTSARVPPDAFGPLIFACALSIASRPAVSCLLFFTKVGGKNCGDVGKTETRQNRSSDL